MSKQGHQSRAAIGKEATWGTGVAVNEILPFKSEGVDKTIQKLVQEYLNKSAAYEQSVASTIAVQGDVTLEGVYDVGGTNILGIDSIILGALGSAAYDSTNGVNKYTVADDILTSFTVAINKDGTVWEVQGAKVNQLQINGSAGNKLELVASLIGYDLKRTGDAGIVNSPTAVDGLSSGRPTLIVFDHLTAKLGTFGASSAVKISEFSVSINNNLSEPQFASGDLRTLEPLRNGFREVSGSLTFPRYDSDTVFQWFDNNTELELTLEFVSGSQYFKIFLPRIIISEPPTAPVGGPELLTVTIPFKALENQNDNTNITFADATVVSGEIGIETKNARTATP